MTIRAAREAVVGGAGRADSQSFKKLITSSITIIIGKGGDNHQDH